MSASHDPAIQGWTGGHASTPNPGIARNGESKSPGKEKNIAPQVTLRVFARATGGHVHPSTPNRRWAGKRPHSKHRPANTYADIEDDLGDSHEASRRLMGRRSTHRSHGLRGDTCKACGFDLAGRSGGCPCSGLAVVGTESIDEDNDDDQEQ